jgi:hypothetical protein
METECLNHDHITAASLEFSRSGEPREPGADD